MANSFALDINGANAGVKSVADAKRILQRFKGRKLSTLSRQQLQTVVVAQSKFIPPSFDFLRLGDIKGESTDD